MFSRKFFVNPLCYYGKKGTTLINYFVLSEDFEGSTIPAGLIISGNGSWSVVSPNNGQTGTSCAQSVNTGDNGTSNLSMTYTFTRGGFISFQSRISSEPNYDNGYFYIDDQEKFKRSGDGS